MRVAGLLSGNAPIVIKYQVGASLAFGGVPVVVAGSGGTGVVKATTTAAVSYVGLALDTATYSAAQASSGANDALTSVIINPDAIIQAKVSGGATENTALADSAETLGSSVGTLVTTSDTYTNFDEGGMFCTSGANQGKFRKITTVSGSAATCLLAFPFDTAIGDRFLHLPWSFVDAQFVQLTTNVYQVDGTAAVDANNVNFMPMRLVVPASAGDYLTNMLIDMVPYDSIFKAIA